MIHSPRPGLLAATLVALALCLASQGVHGDSWGPHKPKHWSANGVYCLRVKHDDWKKPPQLTLEKTDKGRTIRLWSVASPQGRPPISAYIADDGSSVVLFDQHGGTGRGKVLAFLDARGRVGRTFTLSQLVSHTEELYAPHSISSIQWSGIEFFRGGFSQFALITRAGTTRAFTLPSGPVPLTLEDEQAVWKERAAEIRGKLSSSDSRERAGAAEQLALLRDNDATPALKRLLMDPSRSHIGVSQAPPLKDGTYATFPVQEAAGRALATILGDEAVPLFERKLRTANAYTEQTWMWLIVSGGGPNARAACRRHASRPTGSVRTAATKALLEANDRDYARRHPELLNSKYDWTRILAMQAICDSASPKDVPLLRKALRHKEDAIAARAYSALLPLDPQGPVRHERRLARQVQEWAASWKRYDRSQGRSNDPPTPGMLVSEVTALRRHGHGRPYWGGEERHADALCRKVVALRPPGLEEALRNAAISPCFEIKRIAGASLAVLGDAEALAALKKLSQSTDPYYRNDSLRWLKLCGAARPPVK